MTGISDAALRHLREMADLPDLDGTPYEILETLGRGGMGTVYLALDHRLDREVALKIVQLPGDFGEECERLLREARVLATLEHPGIVPVHDAGLLPDGRAFYAMKRVRGLRLDEHARAVPLPDRLRAFERVCETVAFAHAHGVIHRDLKPENVMVGPFGEVLVLDWGVAKVRLTPPPSPSLPRPLSPSPPPALSGREGRKEEKVKPGNLAGEDAFLPPLPGRAGGGLGEEGRGGEGRVGEASFGEPPSTAHGTILGTPGYMAPEQERGETDRITERTDVYALGALLGFLVAGEEAPKALEAIRRRAMAADPEDRYPRVEELAADLACYLAGLAVSAHRESFLDHARRFARNHRTAILLVLAYALMRVLLILILGR
ncbi:MAG TPA: serine/threonine-protein kinase [Thermoanaerobaculia bacterium]|jgi:serine/threonine protein kinase|nr:serine/threonine-protein kinase [Thermoanaerobaculia bacterium]